MNLIQLLARYRVLSALDLLICVVASFSTATFAHPGVQFLGVNLISNFSNFGDLAQRSLSIILSAAYPFARYSNVRLTGILVPLILGFPRMILHELSIWFRHAILPSRNKIRI